MSVLQVLIDSREPDWVRALTFGGAPVEVTPLEAGDLLAMTADGALVGVERKTSTDFLNTLRDERLFDQIRRLGETTEWAYLALCGTLQAGPNNTCHADGRQTGWNWSSVQGALLDVQELGVRVLHVASDYDYEAAVVRLAKRDRGAVHVGPSRRAVPLSPAEAILTSFPGIGLDRAQALLRECGTAAWCIQALTDPAWRLPAGIGPETARRARRALGMIERESLYVLNHDRIELPSESAAGAAA